ncbi:MAG: dTMP kinase [Candidatus Heimdallarchaeaceae archaeon]
MGSSLKGLFIVFEGIDGVGKTTHAKTLVDFLQSLNFQAVYTTEPTHWTEYGKKIRASFSYEQRLPVEEEFQLFLEDRKLHVSKEVLPELEKGSIVVSDRYYFSSVAYQGSRGLDWKYILQANQEAVIPPDIVILLDIPVEEAIERIQNGRASGANSFEKKESLEKVRKIFNELAQQFPDLIVVIDSTRPFEEVHKKITDYVLEVIRNNYHSNTLSK